MTCRSLLSPVVTGGLRGRGRAGPVLGAGRHAVAARASVTRSSVTGLTASCRVAASCGRALTRDVRGWVLVTSCGRRRGGPGSVAPGVSAVGGRGLAQVGVAAGDGGAGGRGGRGSCVGGVVAGLAARVAGVGCGRGRGGGRARSCGLLGVDGDQITS